MPVSVRVARTFLGVLLAVLLGLLISPTAALHPASARHQSSKTLSK